MSTDWPTLRQELERKTLEELERIVLARSQSRITTDEATESLLTLWSVCSGLVSSETMNLVSQAREGYAREGGAEWSADDLIVSDTGSVLTVVIRRGDTVKVGRSQHSGVRWALKKFEPTQDTLIAEAGAAEFIDKLRPALTAGRKA